MLLKSKEQMLPKEKKAYHVLTSTSPYGPSGFAEKKGFIISKEEWATVQAYITTGSGLPVNNDEMKRHVGLSPAIQIPSDFQRLYDVYNEDKHLCNWWSEFLFPYVLQTANDIASYGYKASGMEDSSPGYFAKMIQDLENAEFGDEADKQRAIKDVNARCSILKKEADKYKTAAETARKHMTTFLDGGQDSNGQDVIGVRKVQTQVQEVRQYLDGKYGEGSAEHKKLLTEVDEIKKSLEAAIKAEHELEQKVKLSFILGPLLGFIVYEILENTAVKAVKQKIDALQKKLDEDAALLERDVKIIGMVHSIDADVDNLVAQGEAAIKVFEKIAGIWGSIAAQIDNLSKIALDEIEHSDDTDELSIELDDAAAAWKIIADEARTFVLNAYTA